MMAASGRALRLGLPLKELLAARSGLSGLHVERLTWITLVRLALLVEHGKGPEPHPGHTGPGCQHCVVDPRRNRSSLVAWIVAAVAVVFAIVVFLSKGGGFASNFAGYGSLGLLALLACPLMMGGMMWMMMRKGH